MFHELYADHAGALFGYLARRVGPNLAEDLLADTFHVAIESSASFDARRGPARAWLFGIASNLLQHHWRTEERRLRALARDAVRPPTNIDPLVAVDDHVAERLDAVEAVDRLIDALAALSAEDRTLLFLSGWEHMNSSEIGAAIGQPAATVRSRLRRLRRQLRATAPGLSDDQEALHAWVGAVAAAAFGLVGIASVIDQRSSVRPPTADIPPDATVPTTALTPSIDPVVTDATGEIATNERTTIDAGGDDLAAATGFILPDFIPDGWKVIELGASRSDTWGNPFGATRWAHVVNGRIEKLLSVRPPSPVNPGDDIDADVTVRGVPGDVFTQNAGQVGVLWNESGHRIAATATGLTETELLGAMEALVIDLDNQTVSLPDGGDSLGLVPEPDFGFDGDVITSRVALGHPGVASDTIFAVATPNTFGLSIDGSLPDVASWETLNVDGIDMRLLARSTGQSNSTQLRWIDGDIRFEVHGTVDADTLVEFARRLILTDAATFKTAVAALADQETTTMMTWAELDRVTFDDGITATVRSRSAGSGANAICIEAPIQQCREHVSEATLTGSYADNVLDTFNIEGRHLVVGWQSAGEAQRLGAPILEPGDTLNPADGLGTTTTATVDQLVSGTSGGRFIEIDVPSGERPPRLTYRSGGTVIFDIGAPSIRSAYEY